MKLKLSQLNLYLGLLGLVFLGYFLLSQPAYIGLALIMLLPGFMLTYIISRDEFSFLERLALSLPISNIFLIILRSLSLMGIPFGKGLAFGVAVLLPIAISLINYRFFARKIGGLFENRQLEISKIGAAVFVLAFAVFACWLVWGTLLQGDKLPLTDQVVQFSWTQYYKNSVENFHKYPYWVSEYSGGFPISIFEASLYYERAALNWMFLPGNNLVYHINALSFMNLVLLLVGIYCLGRRFGWGKVAALAAMAFFISSPLLGSKLGYSGDMKEMTSFAILPVMIIVMFLALEKKDIKYYALLGVLTASYYFTNLVPLIPSLIMLAAFFVLYKVLNKEMPARRELWGIGALAATVLLIVGFNLIALYTSLQWGTPETWTIDLNLDSFITGVIKPMFTDPIMQYTHGMGLFFGIAAVAGMALSLIKFRRKENYLLLAFWLALFCYVLPIMKIPLTHVEPHRVVLLILMMFSLFIAGIIENVGLGLPRLGVAALFIIIIAIHLPMAMDQSKAWVNEQAQNGMFEQIYRQLDTIGPGRAINYGIFAYATEPLMPVESRSIWMITHTTGSAARTIPQYELKDGSESALNKDYNLTYILNRMRTTFTRYIIVIKDPGREGDITYARLREFLPNSSILFDSSQLAIFMVPDSDYVQSAQLVKTTLNKTELYSEPDGWKAFGMKDGSAYDIEINGRQDLAKLSTPKAYAYKITSPGDMEIYGNFTGGWIVVKDHYFPTWHAYMGSKELTVKEDNLGTLLIKTEPGDTIRLVIKPYWYEPLLSGVAALAIIFVFVLIFLARGQSGNGSQDGKVNDDNGAI